jgi:hypothetical protein
MMRCKPKLPTYGGAMSRTKKEEFGSAGFKTQQLVGGGPVERAIKQDLISLRNLFYQSLDQKETETETETETNMTSTPTLSPTASFTHKPKGYAFRIFKDVFQQAKFGIIFTRAAPPESRIEREGFTQLIYSAALSLLQDSLDDDGDDGNGDDGYDDETRYFDSMFAIYALYTLYKTNPAPHIPHQPSSQETDEPSSNSHSHSHNHTNEFLTPNEMKQLSTIPIGLTDTIGEADARFYRRSYYSPIRICHASMQMLIRVRNRSFLIIDQCHHSRYDSLQKGGIACGGVVDDDTSKSFRCKCYLAKDCISLIDRLISEQSFHLCEYNGPSSIESLTACNEYVREMILNQNDKVAATNNDHEQLLEEEPSTTPDILAELSLNQLQESIQQYQNMIGKTSIALQRKTIRTSTSSSIQNSNTNQMLVIKKTMEPIMNERRRRRRADNFAQRVQRILSRDDMNDEILSESQVQQDSISNTIDNDDDPIDSEQPIIETIGNDPITAAAASTSSPAVIQPIRLTYPDNFSNSLKEGIDKALKTFVLLEETNELDEEEEYGYDNGNVNDDRENMLSFQASDDERSYDYDERDDMESIMTMETTNHIAGTGNSALQLLLQKALAVSNGGTKMKTKTKKKKRRQPSNRTRGSPHEQTNISNKRRKVTGMQNDIDDDGDDMSQSISIATSMTSDHGTVGVSGSGKIALDELLKKASKIGVGQRKGRRTSGNKNTSSKRRINHHPDKNYTDTDGDNKNSSRRKSPADDVSVKSKMSIVSDMRGSGKEALQQLLKKASKVKSSKVVPTSNRRSNRIHQMQSSKEVSSDVNEGDDQSSNSSCDADNSINTDSAFSRGSSIVQGTGQAAMKKLLERII